MLQVFHHPHLGGLARQLFANHFAPGGSAWSPGALVFVTPVQGIETWLRREITRAFGVAMGHDFASQRNVLAPVIGLSTDPGSAERLASPEVLQWHVAAALQRLYYSGELAQWPEMRALLTGHTEAVSDLWLGLGRHMAQLYDRYSRYMPRELLRWQSDPGASHWQARLWREVLSTQAAISETLLLPGLVWAAGRAVRQPAQSARLILFGYSRLEPLDMRLLTENYPALELYMIAPTGESISDPMGAPDSDNPILGTWGRVARNNEALLLELDALGLAALPQYEPPVHIASGTTLARLQQCLNQVQPMVPLPGDTSLTIHLAPHPAALAQRVRQQLLGWFDDPQLQLQPQDVLILCNDMERYGPALKAALSGVAHVVPAAGWAALDDLALAHSVSDMPAAETDWDARLMRWLTLATGRVARGEVLELLYDELVQQMYGLDAEAVQWLDYATERARVRGGLDAAHRARWVDLSESYVGSSGSWQAFLERFQAARLLGLDVLQQAELWQAADCAEIGLHGQALEGLAQLLADMQQLQVSSGQMEVGLWCRRIAQVCQPRLALLSPTEDQARALTRWYDALRTLERRAAPAAIPLSLTTVQRELDQLLSLAASERGFLRRGITVAGFRPSRIIPARVLVLAGFRAADFPRRAVRSSMDYLTEEGNLAGDWLRYAQTDYGDDDLAMLLNSVMSTAERLALVLESADQPSESALASAPAQALRHTSGCPVYGYDQVSAASMVSLRELRLKQLQTHPRDNQWQPPTPLTVPAPRSSVELSLLANYWRYPALWYLRRLGPSAPYEADTDDDSLVWDPDPLQRSAMRSSALAYTQRHGAQIDSWLRYAERSGLLDGSAMRRYDSEQLITAWLASGREWQRATVHPPVADIQFTVAQTGTGRMPVRIGGEFSMPWRCDARGIWHAMSVSANVSLHVAALEAVVLALQIHQPLEARIYTPDERVRCLRIASLEQAQSLLTEVAGHFYAAHTEMPAVFPDLAQSIGTADIELSQLAARAQERWNLGVQVPSPDIRDGRMRELVETYGAEQLVIALQPQRLLAQARAYMDWLMQVLCE